MSIKEVVVAFGFTINAAELQIMSIKAKYPEIAEAIGAPMRVNGINQAKLCAGIELMLQLIWMLPSNQLTTAFRLKCAQDIARQLRGDISLVDQIERNHAILENTGAIHFRAEEIPPRLTEQEIEIENRRLDAHARRDRIALEKIVFDTAQEAARRVQADQAFQIAQLEFQKQQLEFQKVQFYFANRTEYELERASKMKHHEWLIEQLNSLDSLNQEAREVLSGNMLYNSTAVIDRTFRLITEPMPVQAEMPSQSTGGVYVLRLNNPGADGKPCYYVGHSRCIDTRVEQHATGVGAEWVKAHGGVAEVLAPLVPREEPHAWELRETVTRMITHGVANVRGSEWSNRASLNEDERSCVRMTAMALLNLCRSCGQLGHVAKGCTRPKMNWLVDCRGAATDLNRAIAKALYSSQKRGRDN